MKKRIHTSKDMSVLLKGFKHQWVALNETMDKVVASGTSVQKVLIAARKAGVKEPVLTKASPVSKAYIL